MVKQIINRIKRIIGNVVLIKRNSRYIKELDSKKRKNVITVVFICQMPSLWNSMKSIYDEAINNSSMKVYLVAIPEKQSISGIHQNIYGENMSYSHLLSMGYDVINGFVNNSFFDLKEISPDYVFLPRPYDVHLPQEYTSSYLAKFTRVCYVPYGFSITKECMSTIFNYSFLRNTYLFFPDSEASYSYVKNLYLKEHCNWNKIGVCGFPRFDLLKQAENNNSVKTFLWTPRWTTNRDICGSNFFNYIDHLIEFFLQNKHLRLIFRPHPLLFRNFISTGELTEEKYNAILKIFEENDNLILNDPLTNYIEIFNDVDAMITDPTSLLPEFYYTGKPIIYCDSSDSFNDAGRIMTNGLYYASSWDDIQKYLTALSQGQDDLKDKRFESLKKLNPTYHNGERICKYLLDDYFTESKI